MSEIYENAFRDEGIEEIPREEKVFRACFKKRLGFAVVFIILSLFFSFFSIIDENVENTLMPSHIPVLIGSFICGGPLGFIIGGIVPIIKFFVFHNQTFSMTICSAFELAMCGCVGGYLYRALPKKVVFVSINVLTTLALSKFAYITIYYLIATFSDSINVGVDDFLKNNFIPALFGIAIQIFIVPIIFVLFRKASIAFTND